MDGNKAGGEHNLRIAVGIAMLGLLLAGSTDAADLTVCPGGCAYSGIQDAINASNNGDTILVQTGVYFENVNVTKKLKLLGIGNPVVDSGGNGSTITLSVNGSTLGGFTATGSGPHPEAGINITSSENAVIGNNASNNNGNGISLSSSRDNMLTGNHANSNKYYGIELRGSWNNTLSRNNASYNNNGIYLYVYSNNNLLSENYANSNNYHGIKLYFSGNNKLVGNNASKNKNNGFTLDFSNNNTVNDNYANSNTYDGIYLSSSNNNTIYNNYFKNNNAFDDGNNTWNINKTPGANIVGGPFLGGNFWSDYSGEDIDGDGLGDTMLPYKSSGRIANGGDYLPLFIPLPFAVSINVSEIPVIGHSASSIINVEFTNFTSHDRYNISIKAPNGTRVYYDNAILMGAKKQIISINWTPQSKGNYTIEAWGRGMVDSVQVDAYNKEIVNPVSGLGTIVLVAAFVLGYIMIKRRY